MADIIVLDSDSEEELLPLSERIKLHNSRPPNKSSSSDSIKQSSGSIHRVSSSDDDDDSKTSPPQASIPQTIASTISPIVDIDDVEVVDYGIQMTKPSSKNIKKSENVPLHFDSTSSSEDDLKIRKKPVTRKRGPPKTANAEKKLEEREKKRQAKILEKALKDVEKEMKRSAKPEECIKSMKLCLDSGFTDVQGSAAVYSILLDLGLSYDHQDNSIPLSVQWFRRVAEADVVENKVLKTERDQLEDVLVVLIPSLQFVDLVHAYVQKTKGKQIVDQTLLEHAMNIQDSFPKMKLTYVTVGLDSHLGRKPEARRDGDAGGCHQSKSKCVFRKDVEEVTVALNLESHANYYSLTNMEEFGNFLARFTKAIAEAPFKRDKQLQRDQAFSWYAEADSSRPVKVDKDGTGFINLWQQQILQFQNVGKETAQAIAARFPSPCLLKKAYQQCTSQKEAENLLKDIVVRRDYGPLSNTRKVGPELSYKIYRFFNSKDGNELLQR